VRPVDVPAMPNAHSHAFQRLLRGAGERSGQAGNDFWGWREAMYRVAAGLDPQSLRTAALAAFSQMRAAGYGAVGEFHYLHHRADGRPYREPNAMAMAVAEAAEAAGIRLVLLPAAYARAGWDGRDLPPAPGQRRFCDRSVGAFLDRVDRLRAWAEGRPGVSVGIAAHSARAVPADWLAAIAAHSDRHGLVRHVHAAEQRREVEEVRAEHGCSPVELLGRTGFLGPRASVVHAIHIGGEDVALLADSGTIVVSCPTTEGNLGDGWPPAMALAQSGVRLAIGSDSQVRIDPFEEARELDTGARRERGRRRALAALAGGDLWAALCAGGRASLGLEEEEQATIVVDLDHPDLEGCEPEDLPGALVACASAGVVVS
jgi:formimidoylglutamate deiminase